MDEWNIGANAGELISRRELFSRSAAGFAAVAPVAMLAEARKR